MYDEPTAGLDPVASTVVEDLVRSLRVSDSTDPSVSKDTSPDAGGIAAYIVVTHQHSTIRRSVDRLVFLHEVWPDTNHMVSKLRITNYSCSDSIKAINSAMLIRFLNGNPLYLAYLKHRGTPLQYTMPKELSY